MQKGRSKKSQPCKGLSSALPKGPLKFVLGKMVLMKPVGKRKGGGNRNPAKREGFPDVCQKKLDGELDEHMREMGSRQGLNLLQYTHLQAQQAEVPQAMYKLHPLISRLLSVSPSAKIKYKQLKQALESAAQQWGFEVLSEHYDSPKHLLCGRAADSLGVLLKHWRRVTASADAWSKFVQRLEDAQASKLVKLYKKTEAKCSEGSSETPTSKPSRKLQPNLSEVTVDEDGWPAMLGGVDGSSDEGFKSEEERSKSSGASSIMKASPPPVLKKTWRELARKKPAACAEVGLKRPASAASAALKRPASETSSKGESTAETGNGHKDGSTGESGKGHKDGSTAGGPGTKVHVPSLSLGGGKKQSYIQHQPEGPGTPKRLLVACTIQQASGLKIGHKRLMEELLPVAKQPNATKGSMLEARDNLFKKYRK